MSRCLSELWIRIMSLVVSGRLDASGVTHEKLAASLMSPDPLYAACAGYAQIGRWRDVQVRFRSKSSGASVDSSPC